VNDVLLVGAGLSGLATAWYLREAGASVEVVDALARPGGLIQTIVTPHGPVETAANSFVRSQRMDDLFKAIDLTPCLPLPTSRLRYIFRDGRARRWPLTVGETASTAARFAGAWIARRVVATEGETVDAWGHRVLGSAATDWLVGPALHGIYASPPEALSARAIAASRPTGRREFVAPPEGMGQFVDRLHAMLVTRGVRFRFDTALTLDAIDQARPTVVATSATSAARLLARHAPAFAAAASRVRIAPASPVTAFFEPSARDLHGFGVLFPRAAGVTALGVRFNSDIFAGRGTLRSETWIYAGGAATSAALTAMLQSDRRLLTGNDTAPVAVYPTIWPEAIPVYDDAVLGTAAARSSLPPWLAVAGNYLGKIGVAGLLDVAAEAATSIMAGSQSDCRSGFTVK
jgi:oxygen-dependent protoporphyrinogen oxidase